MKVSVYNKEGEKKGDVSLPSEIFEVEINSDLLHQAIVSQMANRRERIAHTKDRSEKRGGGRKPWRQKGTGRARHGSIRSPIWRGGGVTFGPRKERVFKKKINKKEKKKALFMALSGKAKENLIVVLDKMEVKEPKTSQLSFLENLPCKEGSKLLITPKGDEKTYLAARNIPDLQLMRAQDINSLDLMSFKYLVFPKETIEILKETFLKKDD